jgi:hypothetical protein
MSASSRPLAVPALGPRGLTVDFDGGDLSSDAGFLPLALADQQLQLTTALATAIEDLRDPDKVQHSVLDLLRERIYLIAAGYADANDAQQLRHDPLLKVALRHAPGGVPLASQSTLSRFENRVTTADLARLGQVLLDVFLQRCGAAPQRIVLDFDPFVDPAHGAQQGVLFNGFYDTPCYLPLYLCGHIDGSREYVIGALLRPGNAPALRGARYLLKQVVRALRQRFPDVQIILRADSAFGVAKMLRTCRQLRINYCLGLAKNPRLTALSERQLVRVALAQAQRRRHRGPRGEPCRLYRSFSYRAKTWKIKEQVVCKAEVTQEALNPRWVVSDLGPECGWSPRAIYRFYCGRGNPENRIKEFKIDLAADRLSCEFRRANQFRLILHTAAYHLFHHPQPAVQDRRAGPEPRPARAGAVAVELSLPRPVAPVVGRTATDPDLGRAGSR